MTRLNKEAITKHFNKALEDKKTWANDLVITKENGDLLSIDDAVQELSATIRDFQDLGHDVHLSLFDNIARWKDDTSSPWDWSSTALAGVLKIGGGHYLFSLNTSKPNTMFILVSAEDITQVGNHASKTNSEIKNRFATKGFELQKGDAFTLLQDFIIDKLAHQQWVADNDVANSFNHNKSLNKPIYNAPPLKKSGLKS